jgi:hypothetical protein
MLHLAGAPSVKFSHAGFGTSAATIGLAFTEPQIKVLGRRNFFMHRNPIDTAVSLYFQIHKVDFHEAAPDFHEKRALVLQRAGMPPSAIDEFVAHPVWGIENVLRFNAAWLDVAAREDMLVVRYEEARESPQLVLSGILSHLGIYGRDVDDIVQRGDFAQMQKVELAGADPALKLSRGAVDRDARKVRAGKVGGYVNYLSPETVTYCRRVAMRFGIDA